MAANRSGWMATATIFVVLGLLLPYVSEAYTDCFATHGATQGACDADPDCAFNVGLTECENDCAAVYGPVQPFCNQDPQCLWNTGTDMCDYNNCRLLHGTQTPCDTDPRCAWNGGGVVCEALPPPGPGVPFDVTASTPVVMTESSTAVLTAVGTGTPVTRGDTIGIRLTSLPDPNQIHVFSSSDCTTLESRITTVPIQIPGLCLVVYARSRVSQGVHLLDYELVSSETGESTPQDIVTITVDNEYSDLKGVSRSGDVVPGFDMLVEADAWGLAPGCNSTSCFARILNPAVASLDILTSNDCAGQNKGASMGFGADSGSLCFWVATTGATPNGAYKVFYRVVDLRQPLGLQESTVGTVFVQVGPPGTTPNGFVESDAGLIPLQRLDDSASTLNGMLGCSGIMDYWRISIDVTPGQPNGQVRFQTGNSPSQWWTYLSGSGSFVTFSMSANWGNILSGVATTLPMGQYGTVDIDMTSTEGTGQFYNVEVYVDGVLSNSFPALDMNQAAVACDSFEMAIYPSVPATPTWKVFELRARDTATGAGSLRARFPIEGDLNSDFPDALAFLDVTGHTVTFGSAGTPGSGADSLSLGGPPSVPIPGNVHGNAVETELVALDLVNLAPLDLSHPLLPTIIAPFPANTFFESADCVVKGAEITAGVELPAMCVLVEAPALGFRIVSLLYTVRDTTDDIASNRTATAVVSVYPKMSAVDLVARAEQGDTLLVQARGKGIIPGNDVRMFVSSSPDLGSIRLWENNNCTLCAQDTVCPASAAGSTNCNNAPGCHWDLSRTYVSSFPPIGTNLNRWASGKPDFGCVAGSTTEHFSYEYDMDITINSGEHRIYTGYNPSGTLTQTLILNIITTLASFNLYNSVGVSVASGLVVFSGTSLVPNVVQTFGYKLEQTANPGVVTFTVIVNGVSQTPVVSAPGAFMCPDDFTFIPQSVGQTARWSNMKTFDLDNGGAPLMHLPFGDTEASMFDLVGDVVGATSQWLDTTATGVQADALCVDDCHQCPTGTAASCPTHLDETACHLEAGCEWDSVSGVCESYCQEAGGPTEITSGGVSGFGGIQSECTPEEQICPLTSLGSGTCSGASGCTWTPGPPTYSPKISPVWTEPWLTQPGFGCTAYSTNEVWSYTIEVEVYSLTAPTFSMWVPVAAFNTIYTQIQIGSTLGASFLMVRSDDPYQTTVPLTAGQFAALTWPGYNKIGWTITVNANPGTVDIVSEVNGVLGTPLTTPSHTWTCPGTALFTGPGQPSHLRNFKIWHDSTRTTLAHHVPLGSSDPSTLLDLVGNVEGDPAHLLTQTGTGPGSCLSDCTGCPITTCPSHTTQTPCGAEVGCEWTGFVCQNACVPDFLTVTRGGCLAVTNHGLQGSSSVDRFGFELRDLDTGASSLGPVGAAWIHYLLENPDGLFVTTDPTEVDFEAAVYGRASAGSVLEDVTVHVGAAHGGAYGGETVLVSMRDTTPANDPTLEMSLRFDLLTGMRRVSMVVTAWQAGATTEISVLAPASVDPLDHHHYEWDVRRDIGLGGVTVDLRIDGASLLGGVRQHIDTLTPVLVNDGIVHTVWPVDSFFDVFYVTHSLDGVSSSNVTAASWDFSAGNLLDSISGTKLATITSGTTTAGVCSDFLSTVSPFFAANPAPTLQLVESGPPTSIPVLPVIVSDLDLIATGVPSANREYDVTAVTMVCGGGCSLLTQMVTAAVVDVGGQSITVSVTPDANTAGSFTLDAQITVQARSQGAQVLVITVPVNIASVNSPFTIGAPGPTIVFDEDQTPRPSVEIKGLISDADLEFGGPDAEYTLSGSYTCPAPATACPDIALGTATCTANPDCSVIPTEPSQEMYVTSGMEFPAADRQYEKIFHCVANEVKGFAVEFESHGLGGFSGASAMGFGGFGFGTVYPQTGSIGKNTNTNTPFGFFFPPAPASRLSGGVPSPLTSGFVHFKLGIEFDMTNPADPRLRWYVDGFLFEDQAASGPQTLTSFLCDDVQPTLPMGGLRGFSYKAWNSTTIGSGTLLFHVEPRITPGQTLGPSQAVELVNQIVMDAGTVAIDTQSAVMRVNQVPSATIIGPPFATGVSNPECAAPGGIPGMSVGVDIACAGAPYASPSILKFQHQQYDPFMTFEAVCTGSDLMVRATVHDTAGDQVFSWTQLGSPTFNSKALNRVVVMLNTEVLAGPGRIYAHINSQIVIDQPISVVGFVSTCPPPGPNSSCRVDFTNGDIFYDNLFMLASGYSDAGIVQHFSNNQPGPFLQKVGFSTIVTPSGRSTAVSATPESAFEPVSGLVTPEFCGSTCEDRISSLGTPALSGACPVCACTQLESVCDPSGFGFPCKSREIVDTSYFAHTHIGNNMNSNPADDVGPAAPWVDWGTCDGGGSTLEQMGWEIDIRPSTTLNQFFYFRLFSLNSQNSLFSIYSQNKDEIRVAFGGPAGNSMNTAFTYASLGVTNTDAWMNIRIGWDHVTTPGTRASTVHINGNLVYSGANDHDAPFSACFHGHRTTIYIQRTDLAESIQFKNLNMYADAALTTLQAGYSFDNTLADSTATYGDWEADFYSMSDTYRHCDTVCTGTGSGFTLNTLGNAHTDTYTAQLSVVVTETSSGATQSLDWPFQVTPINDLYSITNQAPSLLTINQDDPALEVFNLDSQLNDADYPVVCTRPDCVSPPHGQYTTLEKRFVCPHNGCPSVTSSTVDAENTCNSALGGNTCRFDPEGVTLSHVGLVSTEGYAANTGTPTCAGGFWSEYRMEWQVRLRQTSVSWRTHFITTTFFITSTAVQVAYASVGFTVPLTDFAPYSVHDDGQMHTWAFGFSRVLTPGFVEFYIEFDGFRISNTFVEPPGQITVCPDTTLASQHHYVVTSYSTYANLKIYADYDGTVLQNHFPLGEDVVTGRIDQVGSATLISHPNHFPIRAIGASTLYTCAYKECFDTLSSPFSFGTLDSAADGSSTTWTPAGNTGTYCTGSSTNCPAVLTKLEGFNGEIEQTARIFRIIPAPFEDGLVFGPPALAPSPPAGGRTSYYFHGGGGGGAGGAVSMLRDAGSGLATGKRLHFRATVNFNGMAPSTDPALRTEILLFTESPVPVAAFFVELGPGVDEIRTSVDPTLFDPASTGTVATSRITTTVAGGDGIDNDCDGVIDLVTPHGGTGPGAAGSLAVEFRLNGAVVYAATFPYRADFADILRAQVNVPRQADLTGIVKRIDASSPLLMSFDPSSGPFATGGSEAGLRAAVIPLFSDQSTTHVAHTCPAPAEVTVMGRTRLQSLVALLDEVCFSSAVDFDGHVTVLKMVETRVSTSDSFFDVFTELSANGQPRFCFQNAAAAPPQCVTASGFAYDPTSRNQLGVCVSSAGGTLYDFTALVENKPAGRIVVDAGAVLLPVVRMHVNATLPASVGSLLVGSGFEHEDTIVVTHRWDSFGRRLEETLGSAVVVPCAGSGLRTHTLVVGNQCTNSSCTVNAVVASADPYGESRTAAGSVFGPITVRFKDASDNELTCTMLVTTDLLSEVTCSSTVPILASSALSFSRSTQLTLRTSPATGSWDTEMLSLGFGNDPDDLCVVVRVGHEVVHTIQQVTFMPVSIFDISYDTGVCLDYLQITDSLGSGSPRTHLVVSNIGSSGLDGVRSLPSTADNIGSSGLDGVRNIGSSGQDGVHVGDLQPYLENGAPLRTVAFNADALFTRLATATADFGSESAAGHFSEVCYELSMLFRSGAGQGTRHGHIFTDEASVPIFEVGVRFETGDTPTTTDAIITVTGRTFDFAGPVEFRTTGGAFDPTELHTARFSLLHNGDGTLTVDVSLDGGATSLGAVTSAIFPPNLPPMYGNIAMTFADDSFLDSFTVYSDAACTSQQFQWDLDNNLNDDSGQVPMMMFPGGNAGHGNEIEPVGSTSPPAESVGPLQVRSPHDQSVTPGEPPVVVLLQASLDNTNSGSTYAVEGLTVTCNPHTCPGTEPLCGTDAACAWGGASCDYRCTDPNVYLSFTLLPDRIEFLALPGVDTEGFSLHVSYAVRESPSNRLSSPSEFDVTVDAATGPVQTACQLGETSILVPQIEEVMPGVTDGDVQATVTLTSIDDILGTAPILFQITLMPRLGRGRLFQYDGGSAPLFRGVEILSATPGTPVDVTDAGARVIFVAVNATLSTNSFRYRAIDSADVPCQTSGFVHFPVGTVPRTCSVNTLDGWGDFQSLGDALSDPACRVANTIIDLNRDNNPFTENNVDFGGVGPLTIASVNMARLIGTGHTISVAVATFENVVFDADGVCATIITTSIATDLTFRNCTFMNGCAGAILSGDPAATSSQITFEDCHFENMGGVGASVTGTHDLTVTGNSFNGVGALDNALDLSVRTNNFGSVVIKDNTFTATLAGSPPFNTAAIFLHDLDTALSVFDFQDNIVSGLPIAVRLNSVPTALITSNMPLGQTISTLDDRRRLRESAKANLNPQGTTFHDMVYGMPAQDGTILDVNFCDDLCPTSVFNNVTNPETIDLEANFKTVFLADCPGSGEALCFTSAGECMNVTVPDCGDGRPCDYVHGMLTDFTIETLVMFADLTGTSTLFDKGSFRVYMENNGEIAVDLDTGSGLAQEATTALAGFVALNTWHHLAVVREDPQIRIYIDGLLIVDTTGTAGALQDHAALNMMVGCNAASGEQFLGKLDETRFWSLARTAAQLIAFEDQSIEGTTTGLDAYFDYDRLGFEVDTVVHDVTSHRVDGALEGFASPSTTAFCASTSDFSRGQYRFTWLKNREPSHAVTGGFFNPGNPGSRVQTIRTPGNCATRPQLHDLNTDPTMDWFDIFSPVTPAFVTPGNMLQPAGQWDGREVSAPLLGTNFATAAPGDYEDAFLYTRKFTLQELLECRPDLTSPLDYAGPLVKSNLGGGVVQYLGSVYIDSLEANDVGDETQGENLIRSVRYQFAICMIEDYGTLVTFSTQTFNVRAVIRYTRFDHDTGELCVGFTTFINHIEQTYTGEQTTQLRLPEIVRAGESGPPMYITATNSTCRQDYSDEIYLDRFFTDAIDARWASDAPPLALEPSQCPADANRFLRLPNNDDSTFTQLGLPLHTHMRVSGKLVAVGDWNGDSAPGERLKISIDGTGTLTLATLSNDVAEAHSFPGTYGTDPSAVPLVTEIGTLCMTEVDGVYDFEYTIPHTLDFVTLRARTIGVLGTKYAGFEDVRIEVLSHYNDICEQDWEMCTVGASGLTDFRGLHPWTFEPWVLDQTLDVYEPRGNGTLLEVNIALDILRSQSHDDVLKVKVREFEALPAEIFSDEWLTNTQTNFVVNEPIHVKLCLDLPGAEVGDFGILITKARVCNAEVNSLMVPFDRYDKENTGCNSPAGTVTTPIYYRDGTVVPFATELQTEILRTSPILVSSCTGIRFMSDVFLSDGRDHFLEVSYNVTVQPLVKFEMHENPDFSLAADADMTIQADGTVVRNADSLLVIAWVAGRSCASVNATAPDGSAYYGTIRKDAFGNTITGPPGIAGTVLTVVCHRFTPTHEEEGMNVPTVNYAIMGNDDPTSYGLVNFVAPADLEECTVEWYMKLAAQPTTASSYVVWRYTATIGGNPAEMACSIEGLTLNCWRTLDTHTTQTAVALPHNPADRAYHYAMRTSIHGTVLRTELFVDGTPAPIQQHILEPAAAPTALWFWPSTTAISLWMLETAPTGTTLDEFRKWTVARTEQQIFEHHDNVLLTPGTEADLLQYYRFDENAGTLFHDTSANGFHGQLVNTGPGSPGTNAVFVEQDMPFDFYGYGITQALGPEAGPELFEGNYALEIRAGTATSVSFAAFDAGTPDFTLQFYFRLPVGFAATPAPWTLLDIHDATTDYQITVVVDSTGITCTRLSVGAVIDAQTLLPAALVPSTAAGDPFGVESRLQHIAFRFRKTSILPETHSIQALVNGLPVPGATAVVTSATASLPQFDQAVTYTLTVAGSASVTSRIDEIRLTSYDLTDIDIANQWNATLSGSEIGLEHYWSFQNPGAPGTAADLATAPGGGALTFAGQAQKAEQNHRPTFATYAFWGSDELLNFATGFRHRSYFASVSPGGATANLAMNALPNAHRAPQFISDKLEIVSSGMMVSAGSDPRIPFMVATASAAAPTSALPAFVGEGVTIEGPELVGSVGGSDFGVACTPGTEWLAFPNALPSDLIQGTCAISGVTEPPPTTNPDPTPTPSPTPTPAPTPTPVPAPTPPTSPPPPPPAPVTPPPPAPLHDDDIGLSAGAIGGGIGGLVLLCICIGGGVGIFFCVRGRGHSGGGGGRAPIRHIRYAGAGAHHTEGGSDVENGNTDTHVRKPNRIGLGSLRRYNKYTKVLNNDGDDYTPDF